MNPSVIERQIQRCEGDNLLFEPRRIAGTSGLGRESYAPRRTSRPEKSIDFVNLKRCEPRRREQHRKPYDYGVDSRMASGPLDVHRGR
jgi:hypothetical protein